jgi:Raf kinase inhibitor-like YbhB/YbcL family protein
VNLDRPVAPDAYALMPSLPPFTVTSNDVRDGEPMGNDQLYDRMGFDGPNLSPHLSWTGQPEVTRSFAVNCFDVDAPIPSGFWHWTVLDIPRSATELVSGAGSGSGRDLPEGAFQCRNDYGFQEFGGAAPPPGERPHRYYFAVHALDCEHLDLDPDASSALAAFTLLFHTVARALLTPVFIR